MRAGKYRERVQIQRRVVSEPTATGQRDTTWPAFASRWAEVLTLAGRELDLARGVTAAVTHTVTIRYIEGIRVTMRVVWAGRTLSINAAIDPDNRRRELVLYCAEEVE